MANADTEPTAVERDAGHSSVSPGPGPPVQKLRIEQHGFSGLLWFVGWLFTIGFLHLPFWKAALALLIWPYYLGSALRMLLL
jgi:hypothetical protein